MDILAWFQDSVLGETLMVVFLVAFIGYLVGSIKIRGVELGTAGVLWSPSCSDILDLRYRIWSENWG